MRKYWVDYWRNFGNTYRLWYTENSDEEKLLPETAERITRNKALQLAREESDRRKYDETFAYYADSEIYPISFAGDIVNSPHYQCVGRIWERVS